MKKKIELFLFLVPFLIGISIFYIVPFVMSIYYSLTKGSGNAQFVGLQNYLDLLNNAPFRLAFKNTLIFMGISIPVIMVLSLSIALLINNKIKGSNAFRGILTLPLVIPVVSIVLFWKIIFSENGSLNSILGNIGVSGTDWLKSDYSMLILILLYLWKNTAYNIIIFLVGINTITYYEAAQIDGCHGYKMFLKITVPLLMPTTFIVFMFSIINCFKVYKEAYLLCGEYPSESMYMLQHFMNNNFKNLNYQRLCTSSIIVFSIIVLLVYCIMQYEKKKQVEY